MMQTIGTFASAHTAPPAAIQSYLGTPAAQAAIPAADYVPQSTQYTQLQLYNQLETLGTASPTRVLISAEHFVMNSKALIANYLH